MVTTHDRVLLEKLTVIQLVKTFPTFTEHEVSSSCSKKSTNGPYFD